MKPCPFCASTDLRVCVTKGDPDNYYVVCLSCLARGGDRYGHGEGEAHAIAAWERRAGALAGLKPRPPGQSIHAKCSVCLGPIVGRNRNATTCISTDCKRTARAVARARR